jgi:hypothetical protein
MTSTAVAAEDADRGNVGRRSAGKLAELLGADVRSLALFRIVLGLCLLVDLAGRAVDRTAFYTDAGVLPRSLLPHFGRLGLPLHRLAGSASFEALLFALAALFAVAIIAGYRTRLFTVLSWVMLISLQERNRLLLEGGDPLLRVIIFWAMFVPLGVCWSVDRHRDPSRPKPPKQLFTIGIAALLFQVASMYFFTGFLKVEEPVWREGKALSFALLGYHMVTPLGTALSHHAGAVKALTYAAMVFEMFGPFLFFVPVRNGPVRTFATFGFIALQVGISLCMRIGTFQICSTLAAIPFLPGWFWDRMLPALGVRRFAEPDGGEARPALPDAGTTLPARLDRGANVAAGAIAAFLFVLNVWTLFTHAPMPGKPERLSYFLGVDQYWNMFCRPRMHTGWTLAPATLKDGTSVDLITGNALSYDKPALPSDIYPDWRFRVYVARGLWAPKGKRYRPAFTSYLCRTWNAQHGEAQQAQEAGLLWMEQHPLDDGTMSEVKRLKLWLGPCGEPPEPAEPADESLPSPGIENAAP